MDAKKLFASVQQALHIWKANQSPVLNLGYVAAKHVERKPPAKRIKNLGKRKKDDEEMGINKRTKSSDQPESEIKANCSSQATET